LANGTGRTNGLTNGLRRTNGLTNGLGRTNGLTNGLGRTNGLTNGTGRTNGLTNGLGHSYDAGGAGPINGFGSHRMRDDGAMGPRKLSALLIIAFVILLPIAFGLLMSSQPVPGQVIDIDGNFRDWRSRTIYSDPSMFTDPPLDITEFSILPDHSSLFVYIKTQGDLLSRGTIDRYFAFVDADQNAATGYAVKRLGAEYLVEAFGSHGHSWSVSAARFSGSDQGNWSAFSGIGGGVGFSSANELELRANLDAELTLGGLRAAFVSASGDGAGEVCAPVVDGANGALVVTQSSRADANGLAMGDGLLTLQLRASGAPVIVNGIAVDSNGIQGISTSGFVAGATIEAGGTATVQVTGELASLSDGAFVRARVGSVSVAQGTFAVVGEGTQAYKGAPPSTIAVDGAFADWNGIAKEDDPENDCQDPNVDISREAAVAQLQSLFAYIAFNDAGRAMAGCAVPSIRTVPTGGGGGAGGNGTVVLPRVSGEDVTRIYYDSRSGGSLLGGIPVDYLVEIRGKDGHVVSARLYRYPSRAFVDDVPVEASGASLEASVQLTQLESQSGQVRIFVETTDWSGNMDGSDITSSRIIASGTRAEGDTSAQPATSGGGTAGDNGADGDPFTLTGNGSVSQSLDSGLSWVFKGIPEPGTVYVDAATGAGATAGYVYILRNDGKVYFTDRSVSGWALYGYGSPALTIDTSYVAIAVGRGPATGYIYLLRSDGLVYFTDRGTSGWSQYGFGAPNIPGSRAYVDLVSDDLTGYVYALRNDGRVYFTDRGTNGWHQYGYGTPAIAASTAYVGLAAGGGAAVGYIYVLRNDGGVYFADRGTSGWAQYGYGAPSIPSSSAYVGVSTGDGPTGGYVYVARNDGIVYFTDRGVSGWAQYGYGPTPVPASTGYACIASGEGSTAGNMFVLRNDGKVYFTDRGVSGWSQYGYGAAQPPVENRWAGIASTPTSLFAVKTDGRVFKSNDDGVTWVSHGDAGSDNSWTSLATTASYVYALRNDGTVQRSPVGSASWTASGGDVGDDTSWVGLAADDSGRLYAIRRDGTVATAGESSWTAWASKGDAGSDTSWVSICAFDATGGVYALRNDRVVYTCQAGTSTTWSSWGSAGSDTSWVGIAADDTYVYALRSDGRIDRAVIIVNTWTGGVGDAGPGNYFVGISTRLVSEFQQVVLPFAVAFIVFIYSKRRQRK
jgi:hypothetical protein